MSSIASTLRTDVIFESGLARSRAWGDSAKVRQILRTMLTAVTDTGCSFVTLESSERSGRATVSVSARDDLLGSDAVAALTGSSVQEDRSSDAYQALRIRSQRR